MTHYSLCKHHAMDESTTAMHCSVTTRLIRNIRAVTNSGDIANTAVGFGAIASLCTDGKRHSMCINYHIHRSRILFDVQARRIHLPMQHIWMCIDANAHITGLAIACAIGAGTTAARATKAIIASQMQNIRNETRYMNTNGCGHIQSILTTTTDYGAVNVHYTCAMHCSTQCTVDGMPYLSSNHQCSSKHRLSP